VQKSGLFSAGNGPAMRSALLGLCFGDDNEKLKSFVQVNTVLTHTDPKAYYGSLAVAKATYLSSTNQQDKFFVEMRALIEDAEFRAILQSVEENLSLSTTDFALKLGFERGVSGYIYQTLPIILHSWLRNPHNLKQAIIDVILCGGDTDTTGAIVGSIVGANSKVTLPQEWMECIVDYPLNIKHIEESAKKLTQVLQEQKPTKAPKTCWLLTLIRNMVFLMIVLVVSITRWF
jgi:ADP-ribosylglycohydrolase